jgi:hypothetical protein
MTITWHYTSQHRGGFADDARVQVTWVTVTVTGSLSDNWVAGSGPPSPAAAKAVRMKLQDRDTARQRQDSPNLNHPGHMIIQWPWPITAGDPDFQVLSEPRRAPGRAAGVSHCVPSAAGSKDSESESESEYESGAAAAAVRTCLPLAGIIISKVGSAYFAYFWHGPQILHWHILHIFLHIFHYKSTLHICHVSLHICHISCIFFYILFCVFPAYFIHIIGIFWHIFSIFFCIFPAYLFSYLWHICHIYCIFQCIFHPCFMHISYIFLAYLRAYFLHISCIFLAYFLHFIYIFHARFIQNSVWFAMYCGYCFQLIVLGTMSLPKCWHTTTCSHRQLHSLSHMWHQGTMQILNT